MNYEQKYEEALKIARHYHDRDNIHFLEHIFPELRESEDEKIKKEIIQSIQDNMCVIHKDKCIAWLEKQGEHANFRNKIQVGDEVTKNEDGVLVNLSQLKRVAKPSEKSANKNKPKFKVGDWITNGEYTWKVIDIKPLDYLLQAQNGDVVGDTISYVDEEFHLWTIGDAKDGDVLAAHECLVLFKKLDGLNIKCYCTYHFMNNPSFYVDTLQNKDAFHPATKEQCDTLKKAMTDAGYTFDFENKELKKIEQKPSWSEEDEKMLDSIIDCLDGLCFIDSDQINWLKSLKPNHWKPSKEQMQALFEAKLASTKNREYFLGLLYEDLKKLRLC